MTQPSIHIKALLFISLLAVLPNRVLANEGVPVVVTSPQLQPIYRQVQVTGSVTSPQVSQLSPSLDGLIKAWHADEGDRVKKGQLLLSLDDELATIELQSDRAQVLQAEAALADAKRRLREAESVRQKGGIAESLIETIRTEVVQQEALLNQRRADAEHQQAVVNRHQVKAPYSGVISKRMAEQGEWVSPGHTVFELVATENLRLDFAVAEDFLAELNAGLPVQFSLNAMPGTSFNGEVSAIVPITTPGDRTFLVRVVPKMPLKELKPGMSASATLNLPSSQQGLVVPRDAILRYPDGRTVVWVVRNSSDMVAREKRVQTGQSFDGRVEIRSGLQLTDQIVVRGNESLQEGQKVRIVPNAE